MKLKKANAIFGLLTIVLLLVHAGYEMYAYIKFIYAPFVTAFLSYLVLGALLVHMVLGMSIMMFAHDGADLKAYPKENRSVIIQRGSAIAMMVLVFAHIKAFDILQSHFGGIFSLILVVVLQAAFFAAVFLHVATSFSKAFITLGWLSTLEKKNAIDRVVSIICAIAFVAILIILTKTYYVLWSMPH